MKTKIKELISLFIQKYSQQIALIISLMALAVITSLVFFLSSGAFTASDIEKNSKQWQKLEQVRITQQSELDTTLEAQKKLEAENSLLRQLFTLGENPKK